MTMKVTPVTSLIVVALTGLIVGTETFLLVPDIGLAIGGSFASATITLMGGVLIGAGLGTQTGEFPLWLWRMVCVFAWGCQVIMTVIATVTKHGNNFRAGISAVIVCLCMLGLFHLFWLRPTDAPRS